MNDLYSDIHEFFNSTKRFDFPYNTKELKTITDQNGLYVLFEKGERFGDFDRIVRIGSHDGTNRLIKRLNNHFKSKNHRLSVFRKHIGRCILNQENNEYLTDWNRPFKSKEEKLIHGPYVDLKYEEKYEEQISDHIHQNLTFTLIPKIYEKDKRDRFEEGLIATLNQSDRKLSSKNWLGNYHPDIRIQEAKIWNIEYLKGRPLTKTEFKEIKNVCQQRLSKHAP